MASRQRSFFDQKPKPQNRYRPYTYKNRAPSPPRPPPPRVYAPVHISSQSRSKLNAFKFVEAEQPMADEDGPEVAQEQPAPAVAFKSPLAPSRPRNSQKTPRLSGHEYPQTPLGRVPLRDLMNEEDAARNTPECSPMDRVQWNRSPSDQGEPCSFITPEAKRGHKRARSSSPAVPNAPFDLQNFHGSLGSDPADPTLDVEKRYFSRAKLETPNRPTASASADFAHSSSPNAPSMGSTESAKLRRTVSCGMEWPARKRRKISRQGTTEAERGGLQTEIAKLRENAAAIPAILDRIQPDLSTAWRESRSFSSSAPQISKKRPEMLPPPHGPAAQGKSAEHQSRRSSVTLVAEPQIPRILVQEERAHHDSSEFDDDELDRTLMSHQERPASVPSVQPHAVEEQIRTGPALQAPEDQEPATGMQHESTVQTEFVTAPDILPQEQGNTPKEPHGNPGAGVRSNMEEDDFSDPEIFADDFESLAKMYDSQAAQDEPLVQGEPLQGAPGREVDEAVRVRSGIQTRPVEISSDDDFDDGIDFDAVMQEYERSTQTGGPPKKATRSPTIQRHLIVSVTEGHYEDAHGRSCPEKVLLVQDEKTKAQKVVLLRQAWLDSPCEPGFCIHVVGAFDGAGQCVVDNTRHFLILHPDHLVSATVVADSFACTRRAVLQDRVKATSAANAPQVYGHMLHEIFQESMTANRWDPGWFAALVARVCARYLESLHEIRVELTQAVEHLMSRVPELQSWAALFLSREPKSNALVRDRNGLSANMSVNKLLDVEEHVWSPTYGLKGNIDATIQVAMQDGPVRKTLTVPLELKTGKNNTSTTHKAQTALYTLLLSDRYDIEIAYGILYYIETSDTSRVAGIRHELLHMIKQRNVLACYVRKRVDLPPMLQDPRMCGKCYAQKACFIYHKLAEDGDGTSSGLKERFNEVVNHLNPTHRDFFRKWDDLLTKEESDLLRFRRELWTMTSQEREKVGRCFADLAVVEGTATELENSPKINRFKYTLQKRSSPFFAFTDSQITIGEPIVISDEKGHFALANGYVTGLTKHRITVAVDRRLHNARTRTCGFDEVNNQSFMGMVQLGSGDDAQLGSSAENPNEKVAYRLDKDEFSNGMATARNNLISIMENDFVNSMPLRKLIVELAPPAFDERRLEKMEPKGLEQSLNVDQKNAIAKVMSAKDYALVLGMPGTGKTTTIAHIIRALTLKGKSVLLTSYTHTAVDNILLKIHDNNIEVLRIGATAKVHPEVQAFAHLANEPKTTEEELKRSYASQVVATTCLGIHHPIFNERLFDYCIVDEASQITLPVCIGPIRMAKTFVLVGDHYQLPPLVQNKQAREGGLDVSLFKLLSDAHPSSVANLEHQYRMCEEIMSLSNKLIYSGRLKCGTEAVAKRATAIPNMAALKQHHHTASTLVSGQKSFCVGPTRGQCWLRDVLDPTSRVVFLNTDPLRPSSLEIAKGPRITNPIEVAVLTQVVESLLTVGVAASDVGVITLYRSQLALLKQSLRCQSSFGGGGTEGGGSAHGRAGAVEMHTADKFQGRDKEVIVLSLVRSNEAHHVGDLLQDWRRLNVALTRARTKLVLVGSLATIAQGNELLAAFGAMVEARGWRRDLAPGALDAHLFEEFATQVSEVSTKATEALVGKGVGRGAVDKVAPKVSPNGVLKVPSKFGTTDPRRLLKNRPVMRDIMNDVTS